MQRRFLFDLKILWILGFDVHFKTADGILRPNEKFTYKLCA